MNKLLLFALGCLLAGCSAGYPLTTNLNPQLNRQPAGIYTNARSATLSGHDARTDAAVIVYRLQGEPEIKIPNETEPHILVTRQLADGLEEQGIVFAGGSPVQIQLDLMELLVTATRAKLLYRAKARSHITLTIRNRDVTLTKAYDREATRDSVTRPPVVDLEKMLNEQLADITQQILQDKEVQTTISQ